MEMYQTIYQSKPQFQFECFKLIRSGHLRFTYMKLLFCDRVSFRPAVGRGGRRQERAASGRRAQVKQRRSAAAAPQRKADDNKKELKPKHCLRERGKFAVFYIEEF
jgi:hypothetical protein